MKTYQDLLKVVEDEKLLKSFLISAIKEYESSEIYINADISEDYYNQKNRTITEYEKILHTLTGQSVADTYSSNHKLPSNFFKKFIMQENQYLLGNGVFFTKEDTKDKLSTKRYEFDSQVQKVGKRALKHGVAYAFYNVDHIEVFTALEFAPLVDEEDGAIKAGIRYWQIASDKPLRMTLYELDGYTEYIKRPKEENVEVLHEKQAYKIAVKANKVGDVIYNGENYEGFPIVPLWGEEDKGSLITRLRPSIDCYDLIKSGFANDIDDASVIYWIVQNAGGMDEVDLAKFLKQIKTVHAATMEEDGAKAEMHTQDVPVTARSTMLEILKRDMIDDSMSLDTNAIANGNTVATAIRAAYEPLNNKTDEYEYCIIEFIQKILELAGIDDKPSFKRSTIINQGEETQMVLSAAQYLDKETVLKHLPFISTDEVETILDNMQNEEMERFNLQQEQMQALQNMKQGNEGEEPKEEPKEEGLNE